MSALKSFAAALLAVVGAIGGLDAASVISVLPPEWGGWIAAAVSVCAAVYHLLDGSGKAAISIATSSPSSFSASAADSAASSPSATHSGASSTTK